MKYLLIFLFPLVINAQSNPSEKEVADKVSQLIKAMIDADENMLKSLTSDKLVYGHSLGAVEDKTAFVQNISKISQSDRSLLTISEILD